MKRIAKAAGCAVLALAVVGLASCGGKKEKTAASGNYAVDSSIVPKQTVTLQVYDQLANFSGEQVGWFAKVMLDNFNVKLNIIPESGNTYTTRMESKNLGDLVIWGDDSDDYVAAAEGGLLFDWEEEDLLDNYGPYIKAHMHQALEKNRGITNTGKVYGFGHGVSTSQTDRQAFFYTWDLRYDLYEKIGKPAIKNYDDLYNALKAMKAIAPTDDKGNPTYGVSLFPDWDGNMVMWVKSLGTAYVGWDEFNFGYYEPATGKYHPCLEENGPYLEALKFLNRLYRDGLLDPDSQTQNYDAMAEDYTNGTAFFQIFNWMGSGLYNTDTHISQGKAMYPVEPADAAPGVYGQSVFGGNRIWSIGANTEYPELCMAIINWLSTPEGFMTSLYGPKGVTWDYDQNGKTYFTELGKKTNTDVNTPMPAPYTGTFKDGSFQMNNITWAEDASNPDSNGETYNDVNWASEARPAQSAIEQSWRDWAGSTSVEDYLGKNSYTLIPGSTYSAGPMSDELSAQWTQVANTIKTGTWRAMYATSDAEFNRLVANMTAEAKSFGYDACNAYAENEAARRKAAEDAAAR